QLLLGPQDRLAGMGVEALHRLVVVRSIFVMVSLDHAKRIQFAYNFKALDRIRIITDNIAEADIFLHLMFPAYFKDGLQGLQVTVNITQYCNFRHSSALSNNSIKNI